MLVYVGAVMVLFLFVVMMLDINLDVLREGFWRALPLAATVGVLMVVEMVLVLAGGKAGFTDVVPPADPGAAYSNTKALGAGALHRLRLSVRAGGGDPAGGDRRRDRAHDAQAQGHAATRTRRDR